MPAFVRFTNVKADMLELFSALLFSVVFIFLLRMLSNRLGLIDHPGGRKYHEQPTPTVGGLAMFLAVLLTLYLSQAYTEKILLLILCSGLMAVLGVLDDKHGLRVDVRMMIQVTLSLIVILGADGMITHMGRLFGDTDIQLGLLAVPFSVLAFVGGINAINMIDGVDGMAGKMALITTMGVAVIFYFSGAHESWPLILALMGALLGFLFFNSRLFVRRAWVFMGDAGSMWVGLMLGWFMAQITHGAVSGRPALVLWLFGIPLLDTLIVMYRRLRCRCSPFHADRTHVHHLLVDAGISVKRTVLMLSFMQLMLVGVGVFYYLIKAPSWLIFGSFVLLLIEYNYLFFKAKKRSPQP